MARRNRISAETAQERVTLRCSAGHLFSADVYCIINTTTDPQALDGFTALGMQSASCSVCGVECVVAEPVLLHDPQNMRFALYVPAVLAHQEFLHRAALLSCLSATEGSDLPDYAGDFVTLVGSPALIEWKGPSALHPRARKIPAVSGPKSAPASAAEQLRRDKPAIHEAFADLDDRGSDPPVPRKQRPLYYVGEGDPENGDDWLDESTFGTAQHALSSGLLSPFDLERRTREGRPSDHPSKAPASPGKGGIARKKLPGE